MTDRQDLKTIIEGDLPFETKVLVLFSRLDERLLAMATHIKGIWAVLAVLGVALIGAFIGHICSTAVQAAINR